MATVSLSVSEILRSSHADPQRCALALQKLVGDNVDSLELGARRVILDLEAEKVMPPLLRLCELDVNFGRVPYHVMEDAFDGATENECEKLWTLIDPLKAEELFKKGKFILLRTCNKLLRKLSRSRHAELCGKILVFLTDTFPFSERSAMNLKGEEGDMVEVEPSDEDDDDHSSFWRTQRWLSKPSLAFQEKDEMIQCVNNALEMIESSEVSPWIEPSEEQLTGRYLTDPHLLRIQLKDPTFRVQICTQIFIVFDYLDKEGMEEASAVARRALSVVASSCEPFGANHAAFLEQVAQDEEIWVKWKKDGCPSLEPPPPEEEEEKEVPFTGWTTPSLEEMKKEDQYIIDQEANRDDIGDEEVLAAACAKLKMAIPTLEEHLQKWEEADDPENGIEDEYHPKNDPLYLFRARRLIVHERPEFLKDMLDGDVFVAVKKLRAERQGLSHETVKGNELPTYIDLEKENEEQKEKPSRKREREEDETEQQSTKESPPEKTEPQQTPTDEDNDKEAKNDPKKDDKPTPPPPPAAARTRKDERPRQQQTPSSSSKGDDRSPPPSRGSNKKPETSSKRGRESDRRGPPPPPPPPPRRTPESSRGGDRHHRGDNRPPPPPSRGGKDRSESPRRGGNDRQRRRDEPLPPPPPSRRSGGGGGGGQSSRSRRPPDNSRRR